MGGGRLASALVELGTPSSPDVRDKAARSVIEELGAWAPPYFGRAFRGQLSRLGSDERDEVLTHALDDVVLTALGGAFRGGNERSAHQWCKRVIANRLRTELRRRASIPNFDVRSELGPKEAGGGSASESLVPIVQRLLELLVREVNRSCRVRDRRSLMFALDCFFSTRLGGSTSRHLQRFGALRGWEREDADAADATSRRSRSRLYQRRRRGKLLAERALQRLVQRNDWNEELAYAARLLGLSAAEQAG